LDEPAASIFKGTVSSTKKLITASGITGFITSIYYLYKLILPPSLATPIHSRTPLIRINWDDEDPDMQKIRITGFFFENVLLAV